MEKIEELEDKNDGSKENKTLTEFFFSLNLLKPTQMAKDTK